MTSSSTDAGSDAWQCLVGLVFANRQRVLQAAAAEDLTPGHAMALMNLDPDNPRPMRRLGEQLRCDPSYLTGLVDRLETQGLVERRPSPTDRRVKELVVTATGVEAQARLKSAWMEPPESIQNLPAADLASLLRIVKRLAADTDFSEVPLFAQLSERPRTT